MPIMTHRQRLGTALNHQQPDMVPLDFGTGGNTSPAPEVYKNLCTIYGIDYQLKLVPHIMRLATVDESILNSLDIDTRPIYMQPVTESIRPCSEPNHFYDEWGVKWKEVNANGVIYREIAENPLQNATLTDLENYPWWPDALDPARYEGVREHAEQMFTGTDFGLVGCPNFNSVWERAYFLCGFSRMLESLVTDPDFVHALFRKIANIILASLEQYLNLVGHTIQVVKIGDDLGSQENSLMSPSTYRKIIKPYHREIFQTIKSHSNAHVFLHSCGSVYKLLPDLIDAGVEILNPVQVSAAGMDTRRLKAEFGDRLSFWGAIDTQYVLPKGTVEEVKQEVGRRIADLGESGGYVVAPVHNVQGDVPAENVVAMYQSARRFGRYPLKVA
jgi:uroporphyrinogen decarboxylase